MTLRPAALDRIEAARRIAREVAGPAAVSVDKEGRFPREAIDALKAEKLLAAYVPEARAAKARPSSSWV